MFRQTFFFLCVGEIFSLLDNYIESVNLVPAFSFPALQMNGRELTATMRSKRD